MSMQIKLENQSLAVKVIAVCLFAIFVGLCGMQLNGGLSSIFNYPAYVIVIFGPLGLFTLFLFYWLAKNYFADSYLEILESGVSYMSVPRNSIWKKEELHIPLESIKEVRFQIIEVSRFDAWAAPDKALLALKFSALSDGIIKKIGTDSKIEFCYKGRWRPVPLPQVMVITLKPGVNYKQRAYNYHIPRQNLAETMAFLMGIKRLSVLVQTNYPNYMNVVTNGQPVQLREAAIDDKRGI